MLFTIIPGAIPPGVRSRAFLTTDNWDDWGKFRTMHFLRVVDGDGSVHDIGSVKIGQVGLRPNRTIGPGQRAPELPTEFDSLGPAFFSLGQGEDYYESLNQLSDGLRVSVLVGLRDIAFDLEIFEANESQEVMSESLLRSVQAANVRNRLHRITQRNAVLTRFSFRYILPQSAGAPSPIMSFDVVPESNPPTNVHVLIGRNGVGKSRCIRGLTEALLGRTREQDGLEGEIVLDADGLDDWAFAGLILVAFSAFDDFDLRREPRDQIDSAQVGLRRHHVDGQSPGLKSLTELAVDFRKSLSICRQSLKAERWRAAVRTLETDDLFQEANVTALIDQPPSTEWDRRVETLFARLSSGHAVVLLTVTRLVELVDEKTLVLLDEPEGHLHPPLLAAFIRCLSDLLVKRNAVAIIATHSPVVLQEVPQSCCWKLRRSQGVSVIERPAIETFGENIGLLTREVFGLEVTRAGFHELLQEAVGADMDYDDVMEHFNGQLGMEAQAIVQALIAQRDEI